MRQCRFQEAHCIIGESSEPASKALAVSFKLDTYVRSWLDHIAMGMSILRTVGPEVPV